jgi:N-acetylmuramidase/Putative peptidoglycan binding domain
MDFARSGAPLSAAGVESTVARLRVEPAALWAVIRVETSGFGFLTDRRPKILFERHVFHRHTGGRFSATAPDVSNPEPGGYGARGAAQYARLERAMALDRRAALRSASWGLGQVMGFHAESLGHPDIEAMVQAMVEAEDRQLAAMERFIATNHLDDAMRARDWPAFALRYNGADFAKNEYDKKLEAAFADLVARGLPDIRVRAAQAHLVYQGFDPGPVDGVMGARTRAALQVFQQKVGLAQTGEIDASTLDRLAAG